jgi:hypothetical protein
LNGFFTIVSPVTGNKINSGSSLILRDRTVLFSFADEPDILVAAGDLGAGFPICAALIVSRGLFLRLGNFHWGFAERHLPMISDAIRISGWSPGPATKRRQIVIGDANFAHHAWNELSCLEELIGEKIPKDLDLVAVHEPLGAINRLFEELKDTEIIHTTDVLLESHNAPGALLFPSGGQIVTRSLIERIFNFSESRMAPQSVVLRNQLRASNGPVLWISVRTRNRTATNQREMLTALGRDFLRRIPNSRIVVDGFSFAANLDQQPSYVKANSEAVCKEDIAEAKLIAQDLQHGWDEQRVFMAVGLGINDSIVLAAEADIYICHHGTVQHKLGWFNAVPGLVHCNRIVLATNPSNWVCSKSEIAIPPQYVPIELVTDVPLVGDEKSIKVILNQQNYTINNIPAMTIFFRTMVDKFALEFPR